MMLCVGFGMANGLYLATIFDQVLRTYNSCNVLEFVNWWLELLHVHPHMGFLPMLGCLADKLI